MNQGVSQALSMLMYTLGAVAIFAVAVAVFGGGYFTNDTGTSVSLYEDNTTGMSVPVGSVWDQLGSTMKR